ncbi:MAG: ABC transporter permease [Chitinophagaceae bacterium]
MASFIINTKAELLKCRKTAAYWMTLGCGVFIPLIMFISYISRPDIFVKELASDPWDIHFQRSWQSAAAFLMPMYVVLVTSLVVQVEYRNNTWKQVYASPRSYADIYFSKFVIVHLMILASFIAFDLCLILGGYMANVIRSDYNFFSTPIPWDSFLSRTSRLYISILGVTSIQYWLSLRFRNYIAPVGIGLALLITGLIIMSWEKVVYYPYAYTALTYFKNLNSKVAAGHKHEWYSLIWFAVVLIAGFWDTVKRRERG